MHTICWLSVDMDFSRPDHLFNFVLSITIDYNKDTREKERNVTVRKVTGNINLAFVKD